MGAARLPAVVGRAGSDFLYDSSTLTTPPRPDGQLIDGIHELLCLLGHKTTTVLATRTSLRFTRLLRRSLTGSRRVVQIVTAPRTVDEGSDWVSAIRCASTRTGRGRRDEAQA